MPLKKITHKGDNDMLILTRSRNQSIVIGEDGGIEVMLLSSGKNAQVKIGIKAAKEIPIHRKEVYQRIYSEKLKNQGCE